jgi:hypothetical protein
MLKDTIWQKEINTRRTVFGIKKSLTFLVETLIILNKDQFASAKNLWK